MDRLDILAPIVTGATLCLAVYQDATTHKIKNYLTVPAAACGILLAGLQGVEPLKEHAIGLAAALLGGILLWIVGTFRAGDAKLYTALGSLMGWKWLIACFAYSIIAGGVIGVALLMQRKVLKRRIKRLWEHLKYVVLSQSPEQYTVEPGSEGEFPFAAFVAIGAVAAMLWPLI